MGVRYHVLASKDEFTTSANTDIFTDVVIADDGILRIGVVTADAGDTRITLDGTNYSTILDNVADVWETVEIPVKTGDTFNLQTVGIEVTSIRAVLISSTERN